VVRPRHRAGRTFRRLPLHGLRRAAQQLDEHGQAAFHRHVHLVVRQDGEVCERVRRQPLDLRVGALRQRQQQLEAAQLDDLALAVGPHRGVGEVLGDLALQLGDAALRVHDEALQVHLQRLGEALVRGRLDRRLSGIGAGVARAATLSARRRRAHGWAAM